MSDNMEIATVNEREDDYIVKEIEIPVVAEKEPKYL